MPNEGANGHAVEEISNGASVPADAPSAVAGGRKKKNRQVVHAERLYPHPEKRKTYAASIYPPRSPLPPEFVEQVQALEKLMGMPVFLFIQSGRTVFDSVETGVFSALLDSRDQLEPSKPVALLIDSPGGQAKCAYQIATLLREHCGGFVAVIPRYAKSAATLLSLGADKIYLGSYAELGPLDAQFLDPEREGRMSALDEVQALERLHAFSLEAADRSMLFMLARAGKKVDTLLPLMLRFATEFMRPLLEKIDAVHYTQMSRALKVAEEYATRLLQPRYSKEEAERISRHLVEHYPEHGFVIDAQEAEALGLKTDTLPPEQMKILDSMIPHLRSMTAIGLVKEYGDELEAN